MSAFGHWDEVAPLQIWDGVVGRAVAGQEATLAAIELDPGTKVPEHHHVNEQTGMLIRGSLTFRIGGETAGAAPGRDLGDPGRRAAFGRCGARRRVPDRALRAAARRLGRARPARALAAQRLLDSTTLVA